MSLRVQAHQGVELAAHALTLGQLLALTGLADCTGDGVALAQAVLLHLAERDVDVARAGQVARGPHERVAVQDVDDARDR